MDCYGCKNLAPDQKSHMDYGGCLYVPDSDLKKIKISKEKKEKPKK